MSTKSDQRPYTAEELHEIFQTRIAMKGFSNGQFPRQSNQREAAVVQLHLEDEDEVDLEEISANEKYLYIKLTDLQGCNENNFEHPNEVQEATTLYSTKMPEKTFKLLLEDSFKELCCLSDLQLEAVVYAFQAHEQLLPFGHRMGFLLGDGEGMGKGRVLAAIIYENYKRDRTRSLWISLSENARFNVERDLNDIGASEHIKVEPIGQFQYYNISSEDDESDSFSMGLVCCTYSELIDETDEMDFDHSSHFTQLIHWLDNGGLIIFDDCQMSNQLFSANADKFIRICTIVLKMQYILANTRVVYASATGVSDLRNMIYMDRLGLWGPGTAYKAFYEFFNAYEKSGSKAMELIGVELKLRGIYMARQLSYQNIKYRIEEVPISREILNFYNYSTDLWGKINEQLVKAYRRMCINNDLQEKINRQFWTAHQKYFRSICVASKLRHVESLVHTAKLDNKAVIIGLQSMDTATTTLHQGELTSLASSSKLILETFIEKYFPAPTNECFHKLHKMGIFNQDARLNTKSPKRARGNSDNSSDDTNAEESATVKDCSDEDDDDAKQDDCEKTGKKKRQIILKHEYMVAQTDKEGFKLDFEHIYGKTTQLKEAEVKRCMSARKKFLAKIEQLGRRMPPNPLDKLILEFGGTEHVAEITDRCWRVVKTGSDTYKYEQRGNDEEILDLLNFAEQESFLNDEKQLVIVSNEVAFDLNLHSNKYVPNQRSRLFISLELPWRTEVAIQQIGCTHRTNQAHEPEIVILALDLALEKLKANMLAKHLESLGAVPMEGDCRANDKEYKFMCDMNIGIACIAMETMLQQIIGKKPLEPVYLPESYEGDFALDCCEALTGVGILSADLNKEQKTYTIKYVNTSITKYFNRILGCRLDIQNALLKFFFKKMQTLMFHLKRIGHPDVGILDLEVHKANVTIKKHISFKRKYLSGYAVTELYTIMSERGMSFDAAVAKYKMQLRQNYEGFYMLKENRNGKNCSILCLNAATECESMTDPNDIILRIYRPNTGMQVRTETLSSMDKHYVKTSSIVAQQFWETQYRQSLHVCSHVYWSKKCIYDQMCNLGLRVRIFNVLSGSLVCIRERVIQIIDKNGRNLQMMRFKIDENTKIVGILVPLVAYHRILSNLSSDAIAETSNCAALG